MKTAALPPDEAVLKRTGTRIFAASQGEKPVYPANRACIVILSRCLSAAKDLTSLKHGIEAIKKTPAELR